MRLSKQTPQMRISADYIDLKSSVLSSFCEVYSVDLFFFELRDSENLKIETKIVVLTLIESEKQKVLWPW